MFDSSGAWTLTMDNFHSAWCCQNLYYYFGRIGRDSDLLFQVGSAGCPAPAIKELLLSRRIPSEFWQPADPVASSQRVRGGSTVHDA